MNITICIYVSSESHFRFFFLPTSSVALKWATIKKGKMAWKNIHLYTFFFISSKKKKVKNVTTSAKNNGNTQCFTVFFLSHFYVVNDDEGRKRIVVIYIDKHDLNAISKNSLRDEYVFLLRFVLFLWVSEWVCLRISVCVWVFLV